MRRGTFAAALLAGAAMVATAAQAQETPPPGEAPPAAPPQDAGSTGIADIVVTAQRRSENLQRAALAVSVVGADGLVQAGVRQAQDISKLVPALKIASTGPNTNVTSAVSGTSLATRSSSRRSRSTSMGFIWRAPARRIRSSTISSGSKS